MPLRRSAHQPTPPAPASRAVSALAAEAHDHARLALEARDAMARPGRDDGLLAGAEDAHRAIDREPDVAADDAQQRLLVRAQADRGQVAVGIERLEVKG